MPYGPSPFHGLCQNPRRYRRCCKMIQIRSADQRSKVLVWPLWFVGPHHRLHRGMDCGHRLPSRGEPRGAQGSLGCALEVQGAGSWQQQSSSKWLVRLVSMKHGSILKRNRMKPEKLKAPLQQNSNCCGDSKFIYIPKSDQGPLTEVLLSGPEMKKLCLINLGTRPPEISSEDHVSI